MVTNLQDVAARPVAASSDGVPARGLWSRAFGHLQSAVCGLHGHDPVLQFEGGRVFLRCTSCGFETPGWKTGDRRPRQRFEGDAARHQLTETAPARTQSIA
jgi:hypothetical protein